MTLEKGSKTLAKSAVAFIPLFLLLQSSVLAQSGSPPTGSVTISGTAEAGQMLSVSNTLADSDTLSFGPIHL